VPFVRFSRDKRGYEHVYLVHTPNKRGRTGKPRVLYWYRSPPGVKVGREAFDTATRRALEAQYPDLTFDWDALAAPPPPAAPVEPWRERRRLRKLQKAPQAETDVPDGDLADAEIEGDGAELGPPDAEVLETDPDLLVKSRGIEPAIGGQDAGEDDSNADESDDPPVTTAAALPGSEQPSASPARRPRRRRRGRRRSNHPGQPSTTPSSGSQGQENVGSESAPESPSSDNGKE